MSYLLMRVNRLLSRRNVVEIGLPRVREGSLEQLQAVPSVFALLWHGINVCRIGAIELNVRIPCGQCS